MQILTRTRDNRVIQWFPGYDRRLNIKRQSCWKGRKHKNRYLGGRDGVRGDKLTLEKTFHGAWATPCLRWQLFMHLWFTLYSPVHNVSDACMRARGVGGLEFESFLGPVKWHQADRQVPFGAKKCCIYTFTKYLLVLPNQLPSTAYMLSGTIILQYCIVECDALL